MKIYVQSATNVDLSQEYAIGLKCIGELRKLYPNIAAKPKFHRSKAWSTCPYITFDLGINIEDEARQYQKSIDPNNYDLYWDYIHEFENTCNAICHDSEFYNDFVQCTVTYIDLDHRLTRNAVLLVFALTK